MVQERDLFEYQTIRIIGDSKSPIGSGLISNQLKSNGIDISEATVGRILKELDIRGYTDKVGYKGRILTDIGRKRLLELQRDNEIKHHGNQLINLIKKGKKDEVIDLLIARKAIEREMASLAALNIKDEQIKKLNNIVASHEKHFEDYITGAKDDVNFHKMIATIANNRILDAAMDLIRHNGQLAPVLGYVRKKVKSTVVSDHKNILLALEKRDPDLADIAMVNHIQNLINDVNKYWKIANKKY